MSQINIAARSSGANFASKHFEGKKPSFRISSSDNLIKREWKGDKIFY